MTERFLQTFRFCLQNRQDLFSFGFLSEPKLEEKPEIGYPVYLTESLFCVFLLPAGRTAGIWLYFCCNLFENRKLASFVSV